MTKLINTGICAGTDSIIHETDRAICVVIGTGQQYAAFGRMREVWLPKSQITWQAAQAGHHPTIHVPAWLARKLFG